MIWFKTSKSIPIAAPYIYIPIILLFAFILAKHKSFALSTDNESKADNILEASSSNPFNFNSVANSDCALNFVKLFALILANDLNVLPPIFTGEKVINLYNSCSEILLLFKIWFKH
jgi:hypothetical protein